ncbi:hypothetical protein J6590_031817 [Homalodisca vitripennis]|nr:hypothetical protein J6590_031817 [Homalodisca vitripennis]
MFPNGRERGDVTERGGAPPLPGAYGTVTYAALCVGATYSQVSEHSPHLTLHAGRHRPRLSECQCTPLRIRWRWMSHCKQVDDIYSSYNRLSFEMNRLPRHRNPLYCPVFIASHCLKGLRPVTLLSTPCSHTAPFDPSVPAVLSRAIPIALAGLPNISIDISFDPDRQ